MVGSPRRGGSGDRLLAFGPFMHYARRGVESRGVTGGITTRDLKGDSPLLYQSALNALRFFGRIAEERAAWVMREVSPFNLSGNSREREMYEQLRYEFDLVD